MKRIFLTGAKGMLASDFIKHFGDTFEILPFDKEHCNITKIEALDAIVKDNQPDVILNFAAYTNVEDAEDIGIKNNFDTNALGVYNLAKISKQYNIDLITISTDYVFDGIKKGGYKENDEPNPINSYGMAKYVGERLVKQENPDGIIIRTSWLYGGGKEFKNFVNTMIRISQTKKELKIVNDQFGSPTYTVDLCSAIAKILENIKKYRGKILHVCNQTRDSGISWFEFAEEIFRLTGAEAKTIPCSSAEFPTKVRRPESTKLLDGNDLAIRDRKEGLLEYIRRIS